MNLRLAILVACSCAAMACRSDEERISGKPYACECELDDTEELGRATVCSENATQALELVRECLSDLPVRFCYCVDDTTTWCDLGECTR